MVKANLMSVTVRWNPITQSNRSGSLLGYRILYAKSGSFDYANLDINSDQEQADLNNLEESTEYQICIAGMFTNGTIGQYSDIIKAKTLEPSSKYILVITDFYTENSVQFFTCSIF